jgi:hypothetical protein
MIAQILIDIAQCGMKPRDIQIHQFTLVSTTFNGGFGLAFIHQSKSDKKSHRNSTHVAYCGGGALGPVCSRTTSDKWDFAKAGPKSRVVACKIKNHFRINGLGALIVVRKGSLSK